LLNRILRQERALEVRAFLERGVVARWFDPETVIDRATFENPKQESAGIEEVWANGVSTFVAGKGATGEKPGRLVTRGRA
jgi:N-acyl-D-amino-acid deacylase